MLSHVSILIAFSNPFTKPAQIQEAQMCQLCASQVKEELGKEQSRISRLPSKQTLWPEEFPDAHATQGRIKTQKHKKKPKIDNLHRVHDCETQICKPVSLTVLGHVVICSISENLCYTEYYKRRKSCRSRELYVSGRTA